MQVTLASFLGYYDFQEWAGIWVPVILFFILIVLLVVAMRQMRPTRPQQIKPEASPRIAWDEIAGVDEAKDELREIVEFLRDPKRFKQLGATVPRGILLHGPPGTGKTLLAKAVAHESGANFFAQSAAAFVETFVGVGAARIRRLFKVARKKAPAIVFIDELDAVGGRRGFGDVSGEKDQTLNQLLVEMDGFTARGDVVVIAASNLLDKLDPALLRPGRFDRQVFVAPPDRGGREGILAVHTRGMPLAPSVDLGLIARQTSGLTGADLASICNEAAIHAARRRVDQVGARDFDAALERVVAGMQAKRGLNEQEKRIVAFHEAGHALCAELLPAVDRVHRISIVPRGGALGYTLNLPEEDRYLKSREELVDRMTMLLGGRAAEQLVFGSVTTGASGDYEAVTRLAAAMVDEYAMGTRVKLRRVEGGVTAEATLRLRDEEQADLADGAYRAALALLRDHRRQLDALAEALLEREVLERADIDRVLADLPRPVGGGGAQLGVAAASESDRT
ncbi:MAG TPA: AAA family ATPase [Conexibacter sp.]|nr:AAA family ATPase [Conexibacter sp.]